MEINHDFTITITNNFVLFLPICVVALIAAIITEYLFEVEYLPEFAALIVLLTWLYVGIIKPTRDTRQSHGEEKGGEK